MAASWAERYGYRVTFARDGESYRVDGRPVTWGETGLRSYMMAETGPIHFTLENRAATADDPELPPCPAYDVGDCTPSALDTPPDARFLHGNAIGFDGAYTLQVRATGSAERYPSGLVWAIECRVEADSAEPTPPLHMSTPMADQQCPNLYWSKTPVGDSIVARLWLRNGAGLTRHIDHVIPVVRKPEDADRGRGGSPPPA